MYCQLAERGKYEEKIVEYYFGRRDDYIYVCRM